MIRRSLAAVSFVLVAAGLIAAGSYRGTITKVSDAEATVLVKKDKTDKGEEKKFKISKDTKVAVSQGKDKEPKDSTLGELTTALKDNDKGVRARIETEGEGASETITKITFGARRKKDN